MTGAARRRRVSTAALAAWVWLALPCGAQPPAAAAGPVFPPAFVAALHHAKNLYVATVRKDGTRSSVVPVWFAYLDNAIWFSTDPHSYKARRLHHGSPLFVSVQGKDGPFVKTKAEMVSDGAMADRLGKNYEQKYWIAWAGFFRPSHAGIESGKIVLVRLTPAS